MDDRTKNAARNCREIAEHCRIISGRLWKLYELEEENELMAQAMEAAGIDEDVGSLCRRFGEWADCFESEDFVRGVAEHASDPVVAEHASDPVVAA